MKIRKMNWFVKLLTLDNVRGITLAPFGIYIKDEYLNYKYIVNHEKIHWKQQIEMLIIFFYLWYIIEWFIKLFSYGTKAYRNISFEREAWNNQYTPNYVKSRKKYVWIKQILN